MFFCFHTHVQYTYDTELSAVEHACGMIECTQPVLLLVLYLCIFVSHMLGGKYAKQSCHSVISKAEEKGQLVCLMAFQGKESRIQATRLYGLSYNGCHAGFFFD